MLEKSSGNRDLGVCLDATGSPVQHDDVDDDEVYSLQEQKKIIRRM